MAVPKEPSRAGSRHPIAVKEWILDYLASRGEAYIAEMHRAYKEELERLAGERHSRRRITRWGEIKVIPYHTPRYHSFQMQVWRLKAAGLIEVTRKEETRGVHGQFAGFKELPMRWHFRLASTAAPEPKAKAKKAAPKPKPKAVVKAAEEND